MTITSSVTNSKSISIIKKNKVKAFYSLLIHWAAPTENPNGVGNYKKMLIKAKQMKMISLTD